MSALHQRMMTHALELAKQAYDRGEVPVGAVIYDADGTIIAAAHNRAETDHNMTHHAELLAISAASEKARKGVLDEYFMAVTLEPCAMCAQAISWARLKELRFGAYDVKSGGVTNGARVFNHSHFKPEVFGGIMEAPAKELMQKFFKERR